jgi:hypothetical protein
VNGERRKAKWKVTKKLEDCEWRTGGWRTARQK